MSRETVREVVNYVFSNAKLYNNAIFYKKKTLMSYIEEVTLAFLKLNGMSADQLISYIKQELAKEQKQNELIGFSSMNKPKYEQALMLLEKVDQIYKTSYIED